jgi:hypothetical protein
MLRRSTVITVDRGALDARSSYKGTRPPPMTPRSRSRDACDQEAIMAHALAHHARTPTFRVHRGSRAIARPHEDALDPMRGIIIGVLLSVAGFWLPLALILAH